MPLSMCNFDFSNSLNLFKLFMTIFNFIGNSPIKPFLGVLLYPLLFYGRDLINYTLNFLNEVIICLINFIDFICNFDDYSSKSLVVYCLNDRTLFVYVKPD